jgi:hypothetical protein
VKASATKDHMPFKGHRTVAVWWEDEARKEILRTLGRQLKKKRAA